MIDASELLTGTKIPSTKLTGDAEAAYVRRLGAILRAGRLNLYYPDARAMRAHLEALSPRVHLGLYDGVEMNLRSGLPTYKEWTRVQTDVAIAADQMRQLGSRQQLASKAQGAGEASIHARQLRKFDYYKKIQGRPLSKLGSMSVALRRVDTESRTAWFHIVLDKLDASGLFVRYSIDLSQTSGAWTRDVVTLNEETAEHTKELESLVYKFSSLDAEFTYAKLNALGGLNVERVVKGTVGPFYFSPEQAPPEIRGLITEGGFLAMFALDMLADDIAEDRDNDPLDDFFSQKLSSQARQEYERARAQFSYRCFKDRKFVVPREDVSKVQAFCEANGTRNIVYGIASRG